MGPNAVQAPTANDGWQPILKGVDAAAANDAITRICVSTTPSAASETLLAFGGLDSTLAFGAAGLAVQFAYAHLLDPTGGHSAHARSYLDVLVEHLESPNPRPGLLAGFYGWAWSLEHCRHLVPCDYDDLFLGTVDDVLRAAIGTGAKWRYQYGLIEGLLGIGVYALERADFADPRESLLAIRDQLWITAEHHASGITWSTRHEVGLTPYFDFGLSGGVPSILLWLAVTARALPGDERTETLLRGLLKWLMSQRGRFPGGSQFPITSLEKYAAEVAPAAWCYGDLGIATAMVLAGTLLNIEEWKTLGVELAIACADRGHTAPTATLAGVEGRRHNALVDVSFCHGAVGVAHILNRLYQYTGSSALKERAVSWFRRVLAHGHFDKGFGGFVSHVHDRWAPNPGLLRGSSGIALALLSATSTVVPAWDRALLLSVAETDESPKPLT